jgi:hypothetical protein
MQDNLLLRWRMPTKTLEGKAQIELRSKEIKSGKDRVYHLVVRGRGGLLQEKRIERLDVVQGAPLALPCQVCQLPREEISRGRSIKIISCSSRCPWLLSTDDAHSETGIPEGFGALHRNTGIPEGLVSETKANWTGE